MAQPVTCHNRSLSLTMAALFALTAAASAFAQERMSKPTLSIELNKAEQREGTCRLVFKTTNGLGVDLSELALETVLLDTDGMVKRFTLFNFKNVPAGKMRVRQFDLPDTQCTSIGQVLINGASACAGDGLSGGECIDHLQATTRIEMEIKG